MVSGQLDSIPSWEAVLSQSYTKSMTSVCQHLEGVGDQTHGFWQSEKSADGIVKRPGSVIIIEIRFQLKNLHLLSVLASGGKQLGHHVYSPPHQVHHHLHSQILRGQRALLCMQGLQYAGSTFIKIEFGSISRGDGRFIPYTAFHAVERYSSSIKFTLKRSHKCVIIGCIVQCNPTNLARMSERIVL